MTYKIPTQQSPLPWLSLCPLLGFSNSLLTGAMLGLGLGVVFIATGLINALPRLSANARLASALLISTSGASLWAEALAAYNPPLAQSLQLAPLALVFTGLVNTQLPPTPDLRRILRLTLGFCLLLLGVGLVRQGLNHENILLGRYAPGALFIAALFIAGLFISARFLTLKKSRDVLICRDFLPGSKRSKPKDKR